MIIFYAALRSVPINSINMADGDIEEKCEHLMNVVVESRKQFGKMCVGYELKSLHMENQILKSRLETISNLRFKSKHSVPDSTQDREDMENFVVKIKERQQRIESLKKKLQITQEVVLQLKTDNNGRQLRVPITAEAMLEKAKIKNLN